MITIADTHVHLYPDVDPDRLWSAVASALGRMAGAEVAHFDCVVLLADSPAGEGWAALCGPGASGPGDWRFQPTAEPGTGRLSHPRHGDLWVLAGRQVVTAERVEVLALALDGTIENGCSAERAVGLCLSRGGVPVLPWSPGKWMGRRGTCVDRLLETYGPERLLIGDVRIRPCPGPEPPRMRRARREGFRILAGSDPLPFPGEEAQAGRYATRWRAPFDPDRPRASLRLALRDPACPLERVGRRNNPVQGALRMWRHAMAKRADPAGTGPRRAAP